MIRHQMMALTCVGVRLAVYVYPGCTMVANIKVCWPVGYLAAFKEVV